jgi:two-component system chemotaxis response regulator CheY
MKKVVIIDDDPDDVFLMAELISEFEPVIGFTVFYEPKSAISALLEQKVGLPDFILTDFNMPKINGLEVCRIFRNDKRFDAVKICVISTNVSKEVEQSLKNLKVDGYFKKPWTVQGYKKILEEIFYE